MKASEAKSISDEVQAQSGISKALDKIRDVANDGQYLAKIYGLTKGQKTALSELGYKVQDEYISWK